MEKFKCECGWVGSKYKMIISMEGDKCPKCDKILTPTYTGWNDIRNIKPTIQGWYLIRTRIGDYEAPISRSRNGNLVWIVPDETLITHWKPKPIEID